MSKILVRDGGEAMLIKSSASEPSQAPHLSLNKPCQVVKV